jgi:hypothetical protein
VTFVTSYPDPMLLSGQGRRYLCRQDAHGIAANIAKLPEQLTKQESPSAHDTGENSVRVTTRSSARTCLCMTKTREDAHLVSKVLIVYWMSIFGGAEHLREVDPSEVNDDGWTNPIQ